MSIDSAVKFLLNETGIIAALVVVVAIIGGVLKIVLPLLERREGKQAGVPDLFMSQVKIEDPPPYSEAGKATFELMNVKGGKAVMSALLLIVVDCGVSKTPKMVEAAAPVSQFTYEVTLSPEVIEYDVRKKEFGTSAPHSYERGEIEAFVVELRTTRSQWYEFQFLIRWYDTTKPTKIIELRSPDLRIEFRPSIKELLV